MKYHVILPQEFVDYVISDAGTEFLESFEWEQDSWKNTVKNWKESKENGICMLSDDIGDEELDDF